MSTLERLQRDFQDYVLGPLDAPAAIAAHVRDQFGLPADARLAIYHNAYRARMREALCDGYEKTWTLVGDDLFHELTDGYLAAHPSTKRNLRWFGDRFAAWCAEQLPEHPFVAELAALEWTLGLAFDAPDAEAASAANMAAVAPEAWGEVRFGLHPSLRLLDQAWNTAALWQALHDGVDPPAAEELAAPQRVVVWRRELRPHFRAADALEAAALERIGAGASFGEVCAMALDLDPDAKPRMAGFLQSWVAQGLLTAPACA